MKGLIEWWARNSVAANLLMIACLIAGSLSFFSIEREFDPSATFSGASVRMQWLGASPQDVEEQIILRIEEAVSELDGVKNIEAVAREGSANVTINGEKGIDKTQFVNDVKSRIDAISTFPDEAFRPVVSQLRNRSPGAFMALAGDMDQKGLARLAREIRDEIAQLPNGSPIVEIWGVADEELAIEVSEEALRRYNLTFDDVSNAVRNSSLNLSGGTVRTETGNLQVAIRSLADSEEEFSRIIIRQTSDGGIVRVRDVATVIDGFAERRQIREMNGRPSISIGVFSSENSDVTKLSEALNKYVEEKNEELGDKAELFIWFDAAGPFTGQLNLVASNAVFGLVLVFVVLMLFLRPIVALWVAVGIAVAFLGAFIFMPAAGVTLNFFTIFGFLLVIGIVVDDAIIVGEAIYNEVEEKGQGGISAALVGAQLVVKPVVFAVLTTMIAFAPWLFIGGDASTFVRPISLTIIFALTFSLIEAFLILPSHLAHMKPQKRSGWFYTMQNVFAGGIVAFATTFYQPVIKLALKARYITVVLFFGAFMVSVALLAQGWISFRFLPEIQGSFLQVSVRLPEGAAFARTEDVFRTVQRAGDELRQEFGDGFDGEPYVKAVYVAADEVSITSYITITEATNRTESTKEVADILRGKLGELPDAEEINVGFTQNQNQPDFSFGIEADDLVELRLAADDLQDYLRTLPGVYDVRSNLQSATPELQLSLKPGAEQLGLTLREISRQVRQAFYGEEVQRLPRDGQDVLVLVRYPSEARASLTTVETMRVRTSDGREVPLAAVADVTFAPSYTQIDRRDRKRSVRVTAEAREGVDVAALMNVYRENFVPEWRRRHPNASLAQRGDAEEQTEFVEDIVPLYAIAFFSMYMLLAIAFSSYWQPALIMTAIPFGFMGAVFGHLIFGVDFALFSFFGVGAAAGVVVNDNLVLIDYVNRLRKEGAGAFEALVRAGLYRFRPIILTSLTTFIGLLPIMYETSTDAQFLKPTIIALAFGVFFATFVTLIFVPAMYAVGADIARFYRWAWTGEKQPPFGEGASRDHGMYSGHIYGDDNGGGTDEPVPSESVALGSTTARPAE
ncbi:MAG: efflux RND transporter permease subunit [Pseudomonadota bacterium]